MKTVKRIFLICALWLMAVAIPARAQDIDYFIHTVRWYEGIKDISKKYDVPVEVIMDMNGLEKPKVKSRQKIKIPANLDQYYRVKAAQNGTQSTVSASDEQDQADKKEPENKEPEKDEDDGFFLFGHKDKVDAILLLPLGNTSDNYYDFYSGALLAAKDLGERGINADITVIDFNGTSVPESLAEKLHNSDIVIGPVAEKGLKLVAEAAGKTAVVSPLDPRAIALADSTSNFVQAPAASAAQYTELASWLAEETRYGENVVLVSETGAEESAGMKALRKALEDSRIGYKNLNYSILEGRNVLKRYEQVMSADTCNRIVVLSEKEAFVNDVVRNLNLMIYNKYSVVLYSASKIRSFDTIDIENLHAVNLHVCCSYFIDYDDPRVKKFILSYRALFNTEPTQFAFQGYDVTGYFLSACNNYGRSWYKKIARSGNSRMLQADFRFSKLDDCGLVNTGIRRIIYEPDYSIKIQH